MCIRDSHRAGQDAVDLLMGFRPYKEGNILLRAIHDIDIMDKHVNIIPIVQFVENKGHTRTIDRGKTVRKIVSLEKLNPVFLFPDTTALAGRPLFETLEEMVELIISILEAFSAIIIQPIPNS